ncbi:phosphoribosylaminoimidazolesuccinocarboxamide synthase [Salicibibacter halophilus]|uniref:Phosphoribosylaminoimidazole-succinocarboxamide synthase n=1 Tax=Salicibibacter halophilus TaxID=2502791 RepID=A0A514LLE1_9BACI|nr:phosphoribosylaminoimidazolesuccinocarboxamide synthase [Salicibibacter halophilus]QDI92636.1 phosphoribosylaminoimidazolesuccinocarboxamide synthase [Salicibibacter halophilus]
MTLLYEGKAKQLFMTDDDKVLRLVYKNDATAFNGEKHDVLQGKGELNNAISVLFFEVLEAEGVQTHFIKKISDTEQLVRPTRIIPIEVVVRNITAGSLARRLGWEEGKSLPEPIVEWYYKDDALGDPLVNDDHIAALGVAKTEELEEMRMRALHVNKILLDLCHKANLLLVDFKLEFGVLEDGTLLLADEVSPDTCRFWDAKTKEKLDKDIYRYGLGSLQAGYENILSRIGGVVHD